MSKYHFKKRSALLLCASTLAMASIATPSLAEQQLFQFFINGLNGGGNFEVGCCGTYNGKAFDTNRPTGPSDAVDPITYPGGYATTSSAPGAVSEASAGAHGTAGGLVTGDQANDAYDGYGGIGLEGMTHFGGLTVTRDVEATHGPGFSTTPITTAFTNSGIPNAIRWVDTFTNSTGSTVSGTLAWATNLGSDSNTRWVAVGAHNTYLVSAQTAPSDPVIAHVFGNNAYTANNVTLVYADGDDNPIWKFDLSVAPGETKRLAVFNILVASTTYDATDLTTKAPDIAYAETLAKLLTNNGNPLPINSPFFTGYSASELLTLLNWSFEDAGLSADTQQSLATIANAVPSQISGSILTELSNLRLDGDTNDTGNASLDGSLFASGARSGSGRNILTLANGGQMTGTNAGDDMHNTWNANGWRAFAIASGFNGNRDALSAGANGINYDGFSATLGVDTLVSPKTRIGTAISYANANTDTKNAYGNSDVDAYALSAYVSHNFTPYLYMDGVALVGWNNYSYNRQQGPAIAHGDTDGLTLGANWVTGFDVPVATDTKAGPYLAVSYSQSELGGYTETGAGIGNLTVDKTTNREGAVEGGAKASYRMITSWGVIVPDVKLGVRGQLGSDTSTINAQYVGTPSSLTSTGFRNGEGTTIVTGLGVSSNVSDTLELKLAYSSSYGHASENNALTLRALLSF